jgi:hypothetical protein
MELFLLLAAARYQLPVLLAAVPLRKGEGCQWELKRAQPFLLAPAARH